MFILSRGALSVLVTAGLAAVALAAATPQVLDRPGLFSENARREADAQIQEIKQRFQTDLVVETFKEIPDDKQKDYDPAQKASFFAGWAKERAQAEMVHGIYILICEEPGRVEIEISADTRKAFTHDNRANLINLLLGTFKKKQFDAGLLAGVRYVRETLGKNQGNAPPVAKPDVATSDPAPSSSGSFVHDRAGLFSKEAVRQADGIIAQIRKEFHKKGVVVETFAGIPENKQQAFKNEAHNLFYADWVNERTRQERVDGVYVLIVKKPGHVEVGVGEKTQERAFTLANRNELTKIFAGRFRAQQYDEGLLEGVRYVQDAMKANLAGTAEGAAGGGFNWMGLICVGLVVLGVIWLVIGIFRAMSGGGAGAGSGGMAPGMGMGMGGGGGFMTGLLGGLFGAMAGNWLYHSFFGGGSGWGTPAAYGGDTSSTGPDAGPDAGQDFSSTGADFDDSSTADGGDYGDSAGGDFDSGGGDFGGGDIGGGGGDF